MNDLNGHDLYHAGIEGLEVILKHYEWLRAKILYAEHGEYGAIYQECFENLVEAMDEAGLEYSES